MSRANSRHNTTAICLLEAAFLIPGEIKDQREGAGEAQNRDEEESELAEEEAEEVRLDGSSNLDIVFCEGVASSFGDLSRKGSLDGVPNTFQRLRPIPCNGRLKPKECEDTVLVFLERDASTLAAPFSFNTWTKHGDHAWLLPRKTPPLHEDSQHITPMTGTLHALLNLESCPHALRTASQSVSSCWTLTMLVYKNGIHLCASPGSLDIPSHRTPRYNRRQFTRPSRLHLPHPAHPQLPKPLHTAQ